MAKSLHRLVTLRQGKSTHQHRHELLHREDAQRLLTRDREQLIELVERLELRNLVLVLLQLNQYALRARAALLNKPGYVETLAPCT